MNGERSALAFAEEEEGKSGGENAEERGEERGERKFFQTTVVITKSPTIFFPHSRTKRFATSVTKVKQKLRIFFARNCL